MKYQSKILIIEDDSITGGLLMNFLLSKGYDVNWVSNGACGIQKAFEYNPDLILCDIKMDPIDGFQVYGVLKESSLLDKVPFIFITGNSDLEDVRKGLDLGVDDYFVKPIIPERLLSSVEKRLLKYKKMKEVGRNEFKALSDISPNGIFLFDGLKIIESNPSFHKILSIPKNQFDDWSIDHIFDSQSLQLVLEKINKCRKGILSSFSQEVNLKSDQNISKPFNFHASVYERYSEHTLMIGLITHRIHDLEEENYIKDILTVLRNENIAVTNSLGEQLTAVFKSHRICSRKQSENFFSKRETEVLCLSMEGLPTKLIADQLSISDRTVEKHRANLMGKTNSKNIIEVIVFALRNNLIDVMKFLVFGVTTILE